jgi:broad specificity phosphatase PhoE
VGTIYWYRHGQTNEDLETNDLVSGWNDIPINATGRLNASRCARRLKDLGITSLTSSDTRRALMTSTIIGEYVGLPIVTTERLRSWNMGSLQGMDHDVADGFLEYFEKNPDIKIPNGESFRTFYNRFRTAFNAVVGYVRKFPNARPALGTHSQDLDLIPWFIKGIEPGRSLEFGKGIEPGGILEVRVDGPKISMRKLKV